MFNMMPGNQQMGPLGQMWPQQQQPMGQFPPNPGMGGPMQGQPGQLPQMGQFPPQMSPGGGGAGAPMQPNGQFPLNPGINGGFQMRTQSRNPGYQMTAASGQGMLPQGWHSQIQDWRGQRPQFSPYG